MEKKTVTSFLPGLEPATFRSWVRRSNHWAVLISKWRTWYLKQMWEVGILIRFMSYFLYIRVRNKWQKRFCVVISVKCCFAYIVSVCWSCLHSGSVFLTAKTNAASQRSGHLDAVARNAGPNSGNTRDCWLSIACSCLLCKALEQYFIGTHVLDYRECTVWM